MYNVHVGIELDRTKSLDYFCSICNLGLVFKEIVFHFLRIQVKKNFRIKHLKYISQYIHISVYDDDKFNLSQRKRAI